MILLSTDDTWKLTVVPCEALAGIAVVEVGARLTSPVTEFLPPEDTWQNPFPVQIPPPAGGVPKLAVTIIVDIKLSYLVKNE